MHSKYEQKQLKSVKVLRPRRDIKVLQAEKVIARWC
jgi:hypothetical protein